MDGTHIMNDVRLGSHCSGTTKSYPADAGTTLWSRFGVLAAWSEQLPCGPGDVLGALLAATHPQNAKPSWTSRSLWNDEALHRAYCTLQLILGLRSMRSRVHWHNEFELASQLTVEFRSLFAAHENELVQCSEVLRNVVRNLASLFAPAGGDIDIKTDIERRSLAAFGRRALVLVATELLLNALGHAFRGRANGHAEVCLQRTSEGRARLRVTDDGIGYFETAEDAGVSQSRIGCFTTKGVEWESCVIVGHATLEQQRSRCRSDHDLGAHTNDHLVSFYTCRPSGSNPTLVARLRSL
jgi:two-component sensor histidine kinase